MNSLKRLGEFLVTLGIPGVFLIAFLDSAAVPMVGGPDAVVLLLSWHRPTLLPGIVLAAALGSLGGCLVLYQIGRTGRNLASRNKPAKPSWALKNLEPRAVSALLVSVLAPPPFPTKAVILAAGVLRVPYSRFTLGVLPGRLVRYGALGYVGARYGDRGMGMIRDHYALVAVVVLAVLVLIVLSGRIRRRNALQGPTEKGSSDPD
jgi:membrane protein YqaA with SNARE-associated domain